MDWSDSTAQFGSLMSICFIILAIIFPFASGAFLIYNQKRLGEEEMVQRWGVLYYFIDTTHKLNLMFYPIFAMRRLLYCFILVLIDDHPALQVFSSYILSSFMIFYLVVQKPITDRDFLFLETINEILIITCNYHLFVFSDMVNNTYVQHAASFSLVVIVYILILVNIAVALEQTIGVRFHKVRYMGRMIRWYCRRIFCKQYRPSTPRNKVVPKILEMSQRNLLSENEDSMRDKADGLRDLMPIMEEE